MREKYLLENYDRYPVMVDSGLGCYLTAADGKRYLDMISGLGVNAFGYSHPQLTRALVQQAARCVHTSNLVFHRHQGMLAERLCHLSGLDRAFFSNSGTEAVEAALKAVRARAYPQPARLVALRGSFHGRTLGSLAVTGQPALQHRFAPFGMEVLFIEPNDREALAAAVATAPAAVILEPVLGEGGIHPLDEGFLVEARERTREAGAWLIADEAQCGLGRTGKYFAYQWAGIHPDIVIAAKPLAAGLPLGATLFTEEAAQFLPPHSHGTTFGGGPLACRMALEFLSLLDGALPQICDRAKLLRQHLEKLRARHPAIREIRSKGLMFGIQLSHPGRGFVDAALERGLLINCTQENVLRLLPPYIIEPEEIEKAVAILDEVFSAAPWDQPLPCLAQHTRP